jgi:hypothetical protein
MKTTLVAALAAYVLAALAGTAALFNELEGSEVTVE